MKTTYFLLMLLSLPMAHANPCRRLLEAAEAFDFNQAQLEYDLTTNGHLKVSTPFRLTFDELKTVFGRDELFNEATFTRTRTLAFRASDNWDLDPEDAAVVLSENSPILELKEFGRLIGQKLELLLRTKLPGEKIYFASLMIRWTSSAAPVTYDDEDERDGRDLAHFDLMRVYLNSVLTLNGDGTFFWNDHAPTKSPKKFSWRGIKDHFPPSGQTVPGEIFVLTGMKRSTALSAPDLATLHSGPDLPPESDRLSLLFYFDTDTND